MKKIILGDVIGHSHDGDKALKEILMYNPDIVLIDLALCLSLMVILLGKRNEINKPTINFIMISQYLIMNL